MLEKCATVVLNRFTFLLVSLTAFSHLSAETKIYTYLGAGPPGGYDSALLKLAFQKTADEYGEFELHLAPPMNEARAMRSIREQAYVRAIRSDSSHPNIVNDLKIAHVPFPIYFGILGYRVCFIPKQLDTSLATLESMEDLRTMKHGQGEGWRDVEVLRDNGFKVMEAPGTRNLYQMLNAGRLDIFCRGVNEVLNEKELYKDMTNVILDDNIALYYPFPFFFYTSRDDHQTALRIEKGMLAAYRDGSMKKLWMAHFAESVAYSKLGARKIFSLENRYSQGLDSSYLQYLFDPGDSQFLE